MNRPSENLRMSLLRRGAVGLLVLAIGLAVGLEVARAAEVVPAFGWMRVKDGSEAKSFASLALRGNLLPALQTELGIAYRNEERVADALDVKMWPVTASLYVTPVPALYAGGGVGWYHTTFDYDSSVPLADETHEEFGVHLGGGLKVPLAPNAAADLGGRYVMMRDQESPLIPQRFDPDFWVTTLGLAIHF